MIHNNIGFDNLPETISTSAYESIAQSGNVSITLNKSQACAICKADDWGVEALNLEEANHLSKVISNLRNETRQLPTEERTENE